MQSSPVLRIGTRKSKLALWQAEYLQNLLKSESIRSDLVLIDSEGDLDKMSALDNFSTTGVFTKSLDNALLEGRIDLAIHSMKDYPTVTHEKIKILTIGKRENPSDVLVKNKIIHHVNEAQFKIGTGSIRRKAQWKYKYPNTTFENLRGNVPTRMNKLAESNWDGIIMAYAGLERLGLINEQCLELSWMIPAPAQGVLGVTFLKKEKSIENILQKLSYPDVELCATIERLFLNKLEGGCSAPIGAHARIFKDKLIFKASLHDPEGKSAIVINKESTSANAIHEVEHWVDEVLKNGGLEIMNKIKS